MSMDQRIPIGFKRKMLAGLLGLLAVALNAWRALREFLFPSLRTRTVLVLEPYCMGDMIALEPMVRAFKCMNYEVRFCTKPHWNPLLPPRAVDYWLEDKIPWTHYDPSRKYRLGALVSREFVQFLLRLRRQGRGVIGLDPRGDVRSVLLLHLAGCRQVVTLSHYLGSDLPMCPAVGLIVNDPGHLRRWELSLLFVKAIAKSLPPEISSPCLSHLLPDAKKEDSRRIGLVPVAPWPGRLWSERKWRNLVIQLQSAGFDPVGLCGPGQISAAQSALGKGIPIESCNSIQAWAEAFSALALVISLDSGPMHLADSLGIPVVGLFGSGKLPLWAPSGPLSQAVHHQDRPEFVPCHQIDRHIEQGLQYMDWIEVKDVMDGVERIQKLQTKLEADASGKSKGSLSSPSLAPSQGEPFTTSRLPRSNHGSH